jgi:hypothetical protein
MGTINPVKLKFHSIIPVKCQGRMLGRIPIKNLLPDYKGISCNPAGQASFLADHKTKAP